MTISSVSSVETGLVSQRVISEEIAKIHADAAPGETRPRLDFPPFRSASLRHPARDLKLAEPEGAEPFAPVFGLSDVDALQSDLTIGGAGEPIGERIMIRGRILDGGGRPGLLSGLFTRIYLPSGPAVLDADPLLSALDARERRAMVAAREADGSLRFDIHLQGTLETPFLAFPRHTGYRSLAGAHD
jgi:protocatechuate 3,4-dioxygenase beta subunit